MQKTIPIELPEALLESLVGLIDVAVRSSGLRSIKDAVHIVEVIETAMMKARASDQAEAGQHEPRNAAGAG